MTKRKNDNYEEALKEFSLSFKNTIKTEIKVWNTLDSTAAKHRQLAFRACLLELKTALENNGLDMSHVNLGGFEIPNSEGIQNE